MQGWRRLFSDDAFIGELIDELIGALINKKVIIWQVWWFYGANSIKNNKAKQLRAF